MTKQYKPRAYLEKKATGWFMGEPEIEWIAYNDWGNYVASAKTNKECERQCRLYGYVPENKY